ncbi:MAG: restriction endonuclease [Patescibacteria group bacterium]
MAVLITKADGEVEPYNPHKLLQSLERAGADKATSDTVAHKVEQEIYAGMTTQEIYRRAFAHLRDTHKPLAARYSLKRAVLEFGPSGFPFEAYLAELFRAEGYTATIDQLIRGKCVEHEVDVVMTKGGTTTYVEAKFHNSLGFKTDLKVALYVKARLEDIGATSGIIATNTGFTDKAEQFAACSGIDLLGWDIPHGNTLHQKIERTGLYPITAMTSLTRREKMALLEQKMVLCRDISKDVAVLEQTGIPGRRLDEALKEAGDLCRPGKGIQ